jgi:hypothetical protein
VLCAAELITGQHHRRALREQQCAEQVAKLPAAERADGVIVGRPFDAAIP